MRWSHKSLFFIFAVLILGEVAICAPINVDSDIVLEARSPVTTRSMTRKQTHVAARPHAATPASPRKPSHNANRAKAALGSSPLRAAHFKKSSATYRRAALKAPTFHRTAGGLVKTKTGRFLGKGKQAGERLKTPELLCVATEKFVIKIIWWRGKLWFMPLKMQVMENSE
jgi:hypothetical protein